MSQNSTPKRRKLSSSVFAAFATLARGTSHSLHRHPMPELREVGREWRRLHGNARP